LPAQRTLPDANHIYASSRGAMSHYGGKMSITLRSKVAAAAIATTVAAVPATALASHQGHARPLATASAVNWQITLKGSTRYPKASGSAQYQSQPGQRELQIEVDHVRSLAGKRVVFSAAGVTLGRATVSARGQADITRNTELGQKVRSIAHGSVISVRTTRGTLIVSGRF
jgi:hypothetical protein